MSKAAYLYDDFSGTSGKWYTTNALTGVVTSGAMRLRPTSSYDYVGAIEAFDLTSSYLSFKLVQNCVLGLGSNTITLTAKVDGTNWVEFVINGGRTYANNATVTMRERVAGANSDTTFRYDPAVHVWFRLREDAGTIYWETSVDGTTWTVRRSKTTTLTLTSVEVLMSGGYWDAEAGTTFATIDDFNLFAGIPPNPKAATLTESFDATDLDKWYGYGTDAAVSGGKLVLTPTGTYSGLIETNDPLDLTGSYLTVELKQNANAGNGTVTSEFVARADGSNSFRFIIGGGPAGEMILRETVAGVHSNFALAYSPQRDRWLRLREAGGVIYWETSSNGVTWSILRSKATTLTLTAVDCLLLNGFYGTEPSPGTTQFDNLNIVDSALANAIGWYVGGSSLGGTDAGTVVQRNFFPAADWLWSPIAPSPTLDPMSATWATMLAAPSPQLRIFGAWNFGVTLVYPHQITPFTPRYPISLLYQDEWGDNPMEGMLVPWPAGTRIPGTGDPYFDGHVAIYDPTDGKMYNLWRATFDGTNLGASWGAVVDAQGSGIEGPVGSSTASALARYAGVIRVSEIAAGEIPHALFFATNAAAPTVFRYPAGKTDGANLAGVSDPILQGARVQLDPSIDLAAIPDITAGELIVGRALQRYGAYCGDNGGARMGFLFESAPDATGDQYEEAGAVYNSVGFKFDYFDMIHLPWSSLRVLKNWDGSP
jgi:hypothetical protein